MIRRRLLLVSLALLVATSCGRSSPGPSNQPPSEPAQPSVGASTALPTPTPSQLVGSRLVLFPSTDGVEITGRLWGEGQVGVILAHGYDPTIGQAGWYPFPQILAEREYLVLTFNFRGFSDGHDGSAGGIHVSENWRDVVAAIAYIRDVGVKDVFLIGASMGGVAVLRAAALPEVEVRGIVSLATPQYPSRHYYGEPPENDATPARLRAIEEPKLFVAGSEDFATGVSFAEDARAMFEAAEEPKQLAIVDSASHSSDLLTYAPPDVVKETRNLIFEFLREHAS